MSSFPTNINLNDTNPPAKPDSYNAEIQAGQAYPDPNFPGELVRDTSLSYRTPQVGGIAVVVDDYQLGDVDSGFTFICNSTIAITITLPPTPPTLPDPKGIWNVKIKNFGTADVTVNPNGANLDASLVPVVLAQNSGFEISTDGTDFWTYGNFGVAPGAGATATASLFSDAEVPGGSINSSNTAFTLANSPSPSGSLELYLNGQFLTSGTDYTLSGSSITMTTAPTTGDVLVAFYRYGGASSSFVDNETPSGAVNGSNTSFALANTPNPSSSLALFLNGVVQKAGVDFALSGLTIAMTPAPTTGDVLRAFYRFVSATAYNFAGEEVPAGTIDGANTSFTLAHSPSPAASLQLYLNGLLLKASDYSLSASTVTMTFAPSIGDSLYAFYRY